MHRLSWAAVLRAGGPAPETGRPGPLSPLAPATGRPARAKPAQTAVTLRDPVREADKVKALYETVEEARRRTGQEPLAYEHFVNLIRREVKKLRTRGEDAATFRVGVRDGKVNVTVRPLKDER